ncbi:type 2 periplasmic-binding domain-containing protein [Gilvimarinus polysaccharolyticus]|uniref:hypothetical protein n=1 Tax=Gilvimarinus polysaccharolyticus TaxID=863921 RepID=UPI000673B1B8|nr:hypothetical protein [Gilvimarinus polysaccharolyticus]
MCLQFIATRSCQIKHCVATAMHLRPLLLLCGQLLACLLLAQASQADAINNAQSEQQQNNDAAMPVTLWAGKAARGLYEIALLSAILDSTADHYPSYKLSVNNAPLGTLRGRQVIAEGKLANVYVSGLREDQYTRDNTILLIRQPVMKGLLGYRAAIIRQGDDQRYAQAAAEHDLRNLIIGQGHSWEDAAILRHNGFTINDNGRFETMFEMLAYARFDAIFLGVAEIEQEFSANKLHEQLTIAYQPIIYYPHAMVFQVSGKHPELAQRIEQGFKIVSDNGTHDQLLKQYFGPAIQRIGDPNTDILVLTHPNPVLMAELAQPLLAHKPQPIEKSND